MVIEDIVDVYEGIGEAGFRSVECWSGAASDACICFLNEGSWERLRTFHKLVPNSRLRVPLRGQNLLGCRHYEDVVVDKFVEESTENGMDVFHIFDALSDSHNLEHTMRTAKSVDKHAQGTIYYTTSPLYDVDGYVKLAGRLLNMGTNSIVLKDMTTLLRPQPTCSITRGIREAYDKDTRISVHYRSTTSVTMVTLMKIIEADVDAVDTAISSMSLGPGHNPTESLVEVLEGTGYTTGLNMGNLVMTRDYFRKVRPRYAEFESRTLASADVFMLQIPGSILSNMRNQLKAQDADDRVDEIMREMPIVRRGAGYPPLVTPSSQIVGTQVVFSALMRRYKIVIAEFANLMLGYYDQCPGERNPELIKQTVEQTKKEEITIRPTNLLEPERDDLAEEVRESDGYSGITGGVLISTLFPSVTPEFFTTRDRGPKNVGKTAEQLKRKAEQAFGVTDTIHESVRYKVTVGNRSQIIRMESA